MARYIDAELIDFNEVFIGASDFARDTREAAQMLIDHQPTADVVEVVRCKDCEYGEIDDIDIPSQYLCHYEGYSWNDENHYCSYGKKVE